MAIRLVPPSGSERSSETNSDDRSKDKLSLGVASANDELVNEQRGLLDLIDKLQFAQLDNVKLPQIVVVGDQSAGKSSVLEAITGTPFPRDAGACTRFATEIRLRRAAEEKITIKIIPANTRSYADQERFRRFGAAVDESTSFEKLMRLAVEEIAPKNIPGRFATEDVLVVEKRGPEMPLLTVVDLPGLVKNPNRDQSADDIRAINDLTDKYMKSPRTIILAVIGGNQDYVQAPILTKAREFDPSGRRTIGVLTKPDMIYATGLEDKFISLVNNNDELNQFGLGWFVLLNPGPREPGQDWPSAKERKEAEETFFSRGKWSTLPQSMVGAPALKQKLSIQLQRHIGKHVRTLQKEIQKAYDECEAELKQMGAGKDTVEEMKEELVQLCSDSKDLVTPAVQGSYTNPPGQSFFARSVNRKGTPSQNLRARAVEENRRFAERVRSQGQKLSFSSETDAGANDGRKRNLTKKEFAKKEVEPLLRQNMGTEFPMDHNPRLVYALFQGYAENWARLAQEHRDNLGVICNEFLGEVVDHVWPGRMRDPLRKELLDPQMRENMQKAQDQVDLLKTDLHFEIQPYDPEYEERLRKWRAEAQKDGGYTEAEEVLEKMLIYYGLLATTFTRNVITQVVERHLLQGLHGIFHWVKINRMNEATVIAIAAENKATRDRRMTLKAKKKAIEEARDICAGLAMRKELRTYDRSDTEDSSDSDNEEESKPTKRNSDSRKHDTGSYQTSNGSADLTVPRVRQTPSKERVSSGLKNVEYSQDQSARFDAPSSVNGSIPGYQLNRAPEPPVSTNKWDEPSAYDDYNVDSHVPRNAPPPPPRPQKIVQPNEEYFYPPSPAESTNNPYGTPFVSNGHIPSTQYAQSDFNSNSPQSAAKRLQRKVLGSKG